MSKHLRLGDRVNLKMSNKHLKHSGTVWTERRDEKHLGIVIELFNDDGDARVWDTVEGDWWCCDTKHLTRLP